MKTPTWKVSAALSAGLSLLLLCSSRADDSAPPCWRDAAGTTYADWSFAVSNNPAIPDAFTNINGTPQAVLTQGTFSTGWKASSLGRTGVWDLGKAGSVNLAIPNFGGAPAWKYVQVQVTYLDAAGLYVAPATAIAGATLVSSQVIDNLVVGPGTWRTQVTLWLLQPSPGSENVVLTGDAAHGLVIDEIIVDTRCPAAGVGDLAAFQPCWRGQTNSTYQNWEFGVSNGLAAIPPELVTNLYGPPQASITLGAFSSGYISEDPFLGCHQGIWDLGESGTMSLNIPNHAGAPAGSYKYVQVQVTEYRDDLLYTNNAAVTIASATLVSVQQRTNETTSFGGRWVVEQTVWRLGPPCPASEVVVLTAGVNGALIDQVVVDTLCLNFPCPLDVSVSADPGQCSKSNVTWSLPAVNGCTVTNVTSSPTNGSTFPVGTNLVTSVIYDAQGGSKTCNFQVVVTDNEPPVVACPAPIVVAKDPLQCGAVVTFAASASDNCSGAAAWCVPASGSLFPPGLTTVTCMATDAVGNVSASCQFTVRVIDYTGDVAGYVPCWRGQTNSTFQQWAFSVSNNPAAIPAELVTNSYGTPQGSVTLGPFSAGYIDSDPFLGCRQGIWDLGESGTMSLNIPNHAGAPAGSYKYVQVQVTEYRDDLLYTNNAAVTIASATLVSVQQRTNETTSFGGRWVVEQTVWRLGPPCPASEVVVLTAGVNGALIDQVVVDTLCLNFPCPLDVSVSADPGQCSKSNVTWSLPAVNGCTVTNVTSSPTNGSTFPVGTNLVTSVIYDAQGGSKTCNFQVVVTDNEPPVVACPAPIVVAKDPLQCGAVVTFAASASDNCSGAAAWCVPASGSLFPPGLTTVTCMATDAVGNVSASCQFTVRVIDYTGDVAGYVPCWRGQTNSTFQQWAFSVSNNPAAIPAELVTNSYGTPQGSVTLGPFSAGYIDSDPFLGCRQGIWDLGESGTMSLNIPNHAGAPAGSYKYVQVQVTEYRDDLLYTNNAAVTIASATLVSVQQRTNETTSFGGRWVVEQTVWRLGPPCPASEVVVLTAGVNGALIDQVVVDTLCLYFPCPGDIAASADAGQCSKSNVTWSLPAVNGCTVTNVTSSPTNGSTFAVGTTPVHTVITDGVGGTRTCDFNVVITDDEPPVAVCKNITVYLDAFGTASITGSDVDNGSTDNCGISNRTVFPDAFTCANKGPNSVTLTVTDVHGHTAACGAIVTVQDNLPPTFTGFPTNITVSCASQVPPADDGLVMATDNCPGPIMISHDPDVITPGTCPNRFVVTRTYHATDQSSNVASQSQIITVDDETPPVITCTSNAVFECDGAGNGAQITAWLASVTATDTCSGSSVVTNNYSGLTSGCGHTGAATVTFTATDACGNQSSCTRTVTVVDTTPPTITCVGDKTIECTTPWTFDAPSASDTCGSVTVAIVSTVTNLTCGNTFVATRTWQATDACNNNSATCSQTVTIVDTTPPTITCVPSKTIECTAPWTFDAPSASDTCGSVTVAIVSTVTNLTCGNTFVATRTWQATDACNNNSATCSQTVTIVDTTPPTISCVGDKTIECTTPWTFDAPSASDTCGSVTVAIVSTVTNATCGNTFVATRTWQATDACNNNSATCSQTVTIVDTTPPTITCVGDKTIECTAPWTFDAPSASDTCGSVTVAIVSTVTNLTCGNTFVATRTWQATDACNNNSATCSQTVTIVDTTPPTITCVPSKTIECTAPWTFDAPSASDTCGSVTVAIVSTVTNLTCGNTFVATRTWQATDACNNNSATCSQTVTIVDTTPPTITCVGDKTIECTAPWTFDAPSASDTCGSVTVAIVSTVTNLTCGNTFVATRTWQATDACNNNSATCSQTVTIVDTTPPTITCVGDKTIECTAPWTFDAPSASDTCGSVTVAIVSTVTNLTCGNTFVATRTWQAMDACNNNSATCSQTVTVVDTTPPSLTCPADLTDVHTDPGQCYATSVSLGTPITSDNCGGTVTVTNDAPSQFPSGTTTVAWTATDACGNTATCHQSVTVIDHEPPAITNCASSVTVSVGANCQAALPDLTSHVVATDNCTPTPSLTITQNPPGGTIVTVGITTVHLIVRDQAGNSSTCPTTVKVVDSTPPTIVTCATNRTLSANATCQASIPDMRGEIVATDNCSTAFAITQNPPLGTLVGLGPTLVTFTVKDAYLNPATCQCTVTVVDTTPPTITCPNDITVTSQGDVCGAVVTYTAPVGTDNCSGAVTTQITGLSSGSVFPAGTTLNTFQVVDGAGNSNHCSFSVTVTAKADLSLAIAPSLNPVPLGTNLTYVITISNGGPCMATGIVVSNSFAGGQISLTVTNGAGNPGQGCPFPGPVSWWQAEGNAIDSADGNNGTLAGGVTYVPGKVGQAFNFDGLTGSVTVPDAPSLRPAALTIEGWVKIQDVTGIHVVIGKRLGAATIDSYSMWIGSGVLFAAMADNAGSGPFLAYPEFPTSSLFSAADIVNLQAFALTLKANADPVSQFITANLSPATTALLSAYVGGPSPALMVALLHDLNAIIQSGSIYTPARFVGVTLSQESTYILGRSPSGSDLVRLNRFLIRDAYPGDFQTTVFPQLNQQFHVAYTFDPASQVQALYVDGQLVNASFITKTIAYDGHPVLIGADDNGGVPGYFYQGDIDELTLYNRALTGTEVRAIYNAGSGGKCQTPGVVQVGSLASGATALVSLVTVPTNCDPVSASATVTASTLDPNLANNAATLSVPVLPLPANDLALTIQRVSVNNNLLRISWPLTCNPYVLQGTGTLFPPILWTPLTVPVLMLDNLNSTIVPATDDMEYFRVHIP